MASKAFKEELRQAGVAMLKGGVAPRHVRRMLRELDDHYEDAREAMLREGLAPAEAEREAARRVGDPRAIADEALGRKELKSLVSRFPLTALTLGPVLAFLLTGLACVLLVAGLLLLRPIPEGTLAPGWFVALVKGLGWFYMYALPALLAAALVASARLRCLPRASLLAGLVVVALLGTLLHISVNAPRVAGEPGSVSGTLSFFGYVPVVGRFSATFLLQDITRLALVVLAAIFAGVCTKNTLISGT